ncbi:MAG: CPBP family glutamic-type intramembrane protease [Phycisphaerales bacterium]
MSSGRRGGVAHGYFEESRRPLHILAFILPLLLLYEAGSARYLSGDSGGGGLTETIRAISILVGFFQDFGAVGRFLPAVALVTVLVVWHLFTGERWRLRPLVIPAMALESVGWTIPLIVLVALIHATGSTAAPALASGAGGLMDLSWQARATISIGAGLYEELLFRMVGIAAVHLVLVDVARVSNRVGSAVAVLVTAAAFAAYHDVTGPGGEVRVLEASQLVCAGAYFGVLYLQRGFGVVVGVHALYDIFVLVIRPTL